MRTNAISTQLIRSYNYSSTRIHLPAWPILHSSFPRLTSVYQPRGATSAAALSVNSYPTDPTLLSPLADVPCGDINLPTGVVELIPNMSMPKPGVDLLFTPVPSSLKPEVPGEPPPSPDMPIQPPTYEPGRTPPGLDPPIAPPEITPNFDPPPGIDPTPEIPIPSPGPDLPSPPIPSPPNPEIPGEPRNPEIPIPPPSQEPGWTPPGIDPPKVPPEITPPSPPEIIPPLIF